MQYQILKINFIGCGRLGQSLGYLLAKTQLAQIQCVLNTSQTSSKQAVDFIGQGIPCEKFEDLLPADLYWIATPDDWIERVCKQLVQSHCLQSPCIVLHSSGLLTSDALQAAQAIGCTVGSLHPPRSFASAHKSIQSFAGTYFAYEGNMEIFPKIALLLKAIQANVFEIKKEQKTLYHAAAVISSNYLVGLFQQALKCFEYAGVSEELASPIIQILMNSALENLKTLSPKLALTGPIQRGDLNTIQNHIKALCQHSELNDLYKYLGRATLELTNHPSEIKDQLKNLLSCQSKSF